MRLDWIKERVGQIFFRLIFLPDLINPIAALPFLHGTPYYLQPPHPFRHTLLTLTTTVPVVAMQSATGTHLPYSSLPLTPPNFSFTYPRPHASM
jgi:hypothetical protein